MNDGSVWYFAYGSNMDPARLKMRCTDKAPISDRIAGELSGWSLAFNKRRSRQGEGAANIMEDQTGLVEGTLNRMPPLGLDKLDRYEGVSTSQYARRLVRVKQKEAGILVDAVTYAALSGVVTSGLRPSREYLTYLLAGRDLLSPAYYAKLAATPVVD